MTGLIVYGTGAEQAWPDMSALARRLLALMASATKAAVAHGSCATEHVDERDRQFVEVVRAHEATIAAICFSYAGKVAEYDDLRQDALVNIWRGLASFRAEASMKTWVYRVVLNSCVSTIRRMARYGRESESLEGLYALVDEPSDKREQVETLHRLLATLGAEDRAIMVMWLDEASYDEIGAVMGMGRSTVATRIRRAKERMAKFASNEKTGL